MIAGLGLDLVEISRVAESLERHGPAFAERILHPEEDSGRISSAEGASHLAGLFAAKEAVMKALGTGMSGAAFKEIAILNRPGGEPYVRLSGRALETASRRAIREWHISITHSRTMAAAVAIALA
ncbi:MAG TPA: holo-ACP synthase [Planctomycetota bacterium]|nr:holo-ACP synthase [Planctomycetota bacterium]